MGVLTSFCCVKLLKKLFVTISTSKGGKDILFMFLEMCDLNRITKV